MNYYELDARRLICPMPVIKMQEKISALQKGDYLEVTSTDRGVLHDIPAWCRIHGHHVIKIEQTKLEIKIVVQVQ